MKHLLSRPRRWAALALAALAATVAAFVASRGHAAAIPPSAPSQHPSPPRPAPVPPGPPPLVLVAGSRLVNGLYLDYPHSVAGAVSAAVEFVTELDSTLDPDRAATIARLTADPSYGAAPVAAARGVTGTRQRLGLPAAGPLPPGTAVSLVPAMFQVRNATASKLTVLLLFDYTATVPRGVWEHLGAMAVTMHWTPAGWRLLKPDAPDGPDAPALIATPGTAAAIADGWKAMTDGL